MKRLLLIIAGLIFLSLTVHGQNSDSIVKPVKRYIESGDTFTVFTLDDERAIVQNLENALSIQRQLNLYMLYHDKTVKLLSIKDSLIWSLQTEVSTLETIDNNNQAIYDKQKKLLSNSQLDVIKLKKQRNIFISSTVMGAIVMVIIFLH